MAIKINGNDVVDNNRKGIFQSANVGAFANPARPASASTGDIIYSTTDGELQVWDGTQWISAGGGTEISASGGTEITSPDGLFKLHYFSSPGTFTLNTDGANLSVAVIAGGGGSGSSGAAGGGAGGVILRSLDPWSSGSYSVTVGSGGAGSAQAGSNGGNSTLACPPSISAPGSLAATGGGGGGGGPNPTTNGKPGGSGGGGSSGGGLGGNGTPGQGFPGGKGGRYYTYDQFGNVTGFGGRGGGGGGFSGSGSSAYIVSIPAPAGPTSQNGFTGAGLALTWPELSSPLVPTQNTAGGYWVARGGGAAPQSYGIIGRGGNNNGIAGGVLIRYLIKQ